jgi:hypothetical protein
MGMKSYPLAMPPELLDQVARTATDTGLSMADAMRQSIKLGLPKLREQLSGHSLEPFTKEEARRAFGPNPEFDDLEQHCARLPKRSPEE